jgi:hypothetical protein
MRKPVDQSTIDRAASRALGHRDACHLVYLLITRDKTVGDWFISRVRPHLRDGNPQDQAYRDALVGMLVAHGSVGSGIAHVIAEDPDSAVSELRRTLDSWASELSMEDGSRLREQ